MKKKELHTKPKTEECETIDATLRKNDKINWKHLLQQSKSKKFTNLKFKPNIPISATAEFEQVSLIQEKQIIPGSNELMQTSSISKVTQIFREN